MSLISLSIPPAEPSLSDSVAAVYRQVGVLAVGAADHDVRLPPERELAAQLRTSRSTLRAALAQLEAEGRLTRRRGRTGGTFLSSDPLSAGPRKMERRPGVAISVPDLLREQGFVVGTRILSTGLTSMPDDAAEGLAELAAAPAALIERIRLADGESLSWEKAYLPAATFPGILEQPLSGSLYELIHRVYGVRPEVVSERIEVVSADEEAANVLGIARGAALLAVTRWTRDAAGTGVEFSYDLFRADRTRLLVRTVSSADGRRAGVEVVPA